MDTRFLEAAAFTVISFVSNTTAFNDNSTRNIYKPELQEKRIELTKATSTQIKIFGSAEAPSLVIGKVFYEFPSPNPIHLAFNEAGISQNDGDAFLNIAKGILAEMRYPVKKVTPQLINDPEENSFYLNLKIHVEATFEDTLMLDSLLTKILLSRIDQLPEKLSFSVYEIG